jgi:hypothetical protein
MLTELEDLQQSEENLWGVSLSIDMETRSTDGNELVQKEYSFSYAEEFDKWMFTEYVEKRTPDTSSISDRNWRKAQHIYWDEAESSTIDVPPEISKALAKATGSDSVTIQVPAGSVTEHKYKQFQYTDT